MSQRGYFWMSQRGYFWMSQRGYFWMSLDIHHLYFELMGVALPVPYYTQVSRRAQGLGKILKRRCRGCVVDVVLILLA
jgi:hypothetical protein